MIDKNSSRLRRARQTRLKIREIGRVRLTVVLSVLRVKLGGLSRRMNVVGLSVKAGLPLGSRRMKLVAALSWRGG